jgi:hypothetical protein
MSNLLKFWAAVIKDAGSKYAETPGILSDKQDGFRHHRSIHDALFSIIMMMEDAKIYNKDIIQSCTRTSKAPSIPPTTASFLITCANYVCPPTFVDNCEKL